MATPFFFSDIFTQEIPQYKSSHVARWPGREEKIGDKKEIGIAITIFQTSETYLVGNLFREPPLVIFRTTAQPSKYILQYSSSSW